MTRACGCPARSYRMLSSLPQEVSDPSVIRRLSFAALFYPTSMPSYWESVAEFGMLHSTARNLTPEQVQIFVENLEILDRQAFVSDQDLTNEIIGMLRPGSDIPLGVVLVSL